MQSIEERFLTTAVVHCRMRPGRVLVAVSGGPDSVALLILLHRLRRRLEVEPVLGHVHHHLRTEADEEVEFCRELAQKLELPFELRHVDVAAAVAQKKGSVETAARELRYRALEEMADAAGCRDIAVGHTADDQAESVLHNLLRGSGIRGLAGMPYRLGRRVRPLLDLYRAEILPYLAAQGIGYHEDATNRDRSFRRNRIRHEVLPFLRKTIQPNVHVVLNRAAAVHREAEAFLQAQAEEALAGLIRWQGEGKIVLDIEGFWRYFSILRKYILRNVLERLTRKRVRPDFNLLSRIETELAAANVGARIVVRPPWELLLDHDGLVIWDRRLRQIDRAVPPETDIELLDGRILRIEETRIDCSEIRRRADADNQFIDAERVAGPMQVRNARPGDRMQPLGLAGHKKVFDIFADQKVPLHKRGEIPVLVCRQGVIWPVGFPIDEQFKVTEQTKRVFHLQVRDKHS